MTNETDAQKESTVETEATKGSAERTSVREQTVSEESSETSAAAVEQSSEVQPTPAPTAGGESEAVAALTAERDRLKDALLRALADLDNLRKRTRREVEEAARKAKEDILRELLPVFDNLERAAQYVDSGADLKAIGQGIAMVLRLFEDTLNKLGGKRLRPVGQPFDPTQHEAIQQVESAEYPAGTVAGEALAGYMFQDRLLRPAMVVVSKGPPAESTASSEHAGNGGGQTES